MFLIILISALLAVDSFITCLSIGICHNKIKSRRIWLLIGTISLFHFIMPLVGFSLSTLFSDIDFTITKFIAAATFAFLGLKMLVEGVVTIRANVPCEQETTYLPIERIIIMSLLLSLDAAAAGLSVSIIKPDITPFAIAIFATLFCFIFSTIGYYIGKLLHRHVRLYANIAAGALMLLLAFKTALP